MKDNTARILRIFLTVLLVISVVLFIMFLVQGESFTSTVLTWAYILLAFTATITLIFPLIYFIMNPGKAKTMLIGIVGFAVLFFIAYSISTGSIVGDVYEKFAITESASRIIGASLLMTYILGGLTVLSIVYAGISNLFK